MLRLGDLHHLFLLAEHLFVSCFKCLIELNTDLLVTTESPIAESSVESSLVDHFEKVRAFSLCVGIKMVLTSMKSDPLPYFSSKGTTCNRPNDINSVLLSLDEVSPGTEDVPTLLNIGVALNSTNVRVKGILELLMQRVSHVGCFLESLLKFLLFILSLLCLLVA